MSRVAVFVDAGYLFAQGSTALSGAKKPRSTLVLNETAVVSELRDVAAAKSEGASFLRVYWYDAPLSGGRLSVEHTSLALSDHVKLRLGFLNSVGQQKGVDSLIVTDMIELARNRAITDAVLLAGDEDVRIGVLIAQSFGVRVHLLGIEPSRGSQSHLLMQEADTKTEWAKDVVEKFLVYQERTSNAETLPVSAATPSERPAGPDLDSVARAIVAALTPEQLGALKAYWDANKGIPPEHDRPLLGKTRTALGRDLQSGERARMRTAFVQLAKARIDEGA